MNVNVKINAKFLPHLYDYKHRYNIYFGGRGSGKSHFIVDKLIIKALASQRKVLFIRKTATSLKDSTYQLVIDALSKFKIKSFCKINKSTYTITLPNESVLLFKGLDDGEKAKGIQGITDIFIDEANQLLFDEFDALDKSLRHPTAEGQQIYLAYNPVSKVNWVYKHWHIQPQPDTFYLHSTYKDNAFLPQSYIDSIERLRETNPTLYKIVGLGDFASLDKLVYPYFEVQDFNHRDIKGTYIAGIDFGFNDPTAFVCAKVNERTKTIYVYFEHVQPQLTNDKVAKMLRDNGYGKEPIIADSAEPKTIEELKRQGIYRIKPAKKPAGSVVSGIRNIQAYKLIIHSSCETVIEELQNYSWMKDKQSGEYTDKPIDNFNHCLDALRYAMQLITNKSTLQLTSKAQLGL